MRFAQQLIKRLAAFRLGHAFESNRQTSRQPLSIVSGRDDHLDMRRQLWREPVQRRAGSLAAS